MMTDPLSQVADLQIGLVFYADDPTQSIFRTVYQLPWEDSAVLDDPAHVTNEILIDVKGNPIPGARAATILKVPRDNPQGLGGPHISIGTSAAAALTNLVVKYVPAVVAANDQAIPNPQVQAAALQAAQQAANLKGATPTSIIVAAQNAALNATTAASPK